MYFLKILAITPLFFFSFTEPQEKFLEIYSIKTGDYLYTHCRNEVKILASGYDVSELELSCKGCEVSNGLDSATFLVYPGPGRTIELNVRWKDQLIHTKTFNTMRPPLPSVELVSEGRPLNTKQGVAADQLKSVQVKILPEITFEVLFPEEGLYEASNAEMILVRGKRPVYVKQINGPEAVDISNWKMEPNDRIVVEVNEVVRKTSKGEKVNITYRNVQNIPLY